MIEEDKTSKQLKKKISEYKQIENLLQNQQVRLEEQLSFACNLNRMAETIILNEDTLIILETMAEIVGEALGVDRCLIYDMDFKQHLVIGLCEWLNPKTPDIAATKATYNRDIFLNGTDFMMKYQKWVQSHADDINPILISDGSAEVLHNNMNIKSGLWYPFSFRNQQGYYCLVFNQVNHRRIWREEEINFITAVAQQVEIAIQKISLLTERKQMEKEMMRLERLNLVGEMAAGIGHEIRNPMTAVRGFLQILGRKKEYVQDKEYFSLMIEELDRANSIITEFLSLARNKSIELSEHNLENIVRAIYPLIQAEAIRMDINFKLDLVSVPNLLLDEKEIRQLILNFVHNSFEAMPPGGNLTVRTYTEGEEVILAVQDQGAGIEPDALEKLGTPFFTTKDNGTGLGLAVCYSIAARHNAKIKIETGSEGTTFFVRFKQK